jgi:hypothetical protein
VRRARLRYISPGSSPTLANPCCQSCEEELLRLHEMTSSRAVRKREDYLLEKLRAAQVKVETVEKQSVELKKVLAKGG